MNYRKCVFVLLIAFLLFAGGNYLVWVFWTESLLTFNKGYGGDLARMGYVSSVKVQRKNSIDLPKKHIEGVDYRGGSIDMITVGDSFSQGTVGGKNHYYQDYIASLKNMKVVNLPSLKLPDEDDEKSHFRTVLKLANSGWLRSRSVKYVLLESTEWLCVERFSRKFDFSESDDPARLSTVYASYRKKYDLPEIGFINNGNLKWLIQPISYKLSGHDFNKKIYKAKLDRDFFTSKDSRTLLFFHKNINVTPRFSLNDVTGMNEQLNLLADVLSRQGIKLIFMPCVDKYNLYSDFIVNNAYPRSSFFEKLRPLPKRYLFVDTKALLSDSVRNGVKDIYYADDSHLSWKAYEIIFQSLILSGS